jgi:predicted nuclease of predicted toxin-antitoxin system
MPALRFVFDQHVNGKALRQLREGGLDVVHVADVGLSESDDPEILSWARREDRIVVTRNYRDFAPLVEAYAKQGIDLPGVLFLASSIRHSDVGHHVRAVLGFVRAAEEAGRNPVRGGAGWLR